MGLVGRLENKSTDHQKGIAAVPLWVSPEPRRPGWDYRSPIIADDLQLPGSAQYANPFRQTADTLQHVFELAG